MEPLTLLAWLAWLTRLALLAVLTGIGGALWALHAYDACVPPAPELCLCLSGDWDPLDVRWRRLVGALDALVLAPCWITISAASAAVGHLVAWLFGRRSFRSVFDDVWVAYAAANYRECGCALGRGALVPVVRVGPGGATALAGARAIEVCPSLAAQSPFRYIRSEALAAAGVSVPGVAAAAPASPAPSGGASPASAASADPGHPAAPEPE